MLVGAFTTIIILTAIVSITLACWSLYYHYHSEGNSTYQLRTLACWSSYYHDHTEGNSINYTCLLEYLRTAIIILKIIVTITLAGWSINYHYHTEGNSVNYTCLLELLLRKASFTFACWSIYYHYHTEGNGIN